MTTQLLKTLQSRLGEDLLIGNWETITQERIDAFAELTGDRQWIHTDPERARRESPYGGTVAHGFLTLSLIPGLTGSNTPEFMARHFPGMRMRVNYGLNKVRFPAPVPAGSKVRARMSIAEARQAGEGVEVVCLMTVELEGSEKPACVAEQVFRLYP
ncbi:MAG: enoyl-CoA hydratase [Desulfuromonas sp.]|uniref:MaoC family dehydratase n=1 Tax=Desulfuromonas sp. TaxID=892 RepID=UPI000CC0DE98|nr:MaoC family dehydratase [Desulfuromonas sp.]PLX81968.1 MAG: enoyl-CoA hydratase [Desulfuromonas sp.]